MFNCLISCSRFIMFRTERNCTNLNDNGRIFKLEFKSGKESKIKDIFFRLCSR